MIVLNEVEYAEECLEEGRIEKKPFFTLSILAKYYSKHLNYGKKQIAENLKLFMKDNYFKYQNEHLYWDEVIGKLAKNAHKYALHEIDCIHITESEWNTITNIGNKSLERLAFTLLCLAKLEMQKNPKNTGWVNYDVKQIFTLARISGNVESRYIRLNMLLNLGLIELSKRSDVINFRVTFIDDESKEKIAVSDFRELGYEYMRNIGENYIQCAKCGILIKGNKNGTRIFCHDCAAKKPNNYKRIKCADCGAMFKVSSKNNKTCRCENCQKKRDNEKDRARKMEERKNQRMLSFQP